MWKVGLAITALLVALLACGPPPVTPTPTQSVQLNATVTQAATATIVERVITLTPKPSATVGVSQTRPYTPTTRPTATRAPTATQTRPPAPTRTPAPVALPTETPALSTETPAPVIIPTDTLVPAPTNYDRNGDGKVTCADFSTQAEAQAAYNAGYTNLDGNDNDGLACESLP